MISISHCIILFSLAHLNIAEDLVDYFVEVKTGDGPGAGTDAAFQVTVIGSREETVSVILNGEGKKLERGSHDKFNFAGKDVHGIDRILVQRKQKNSLFDSWYCKWIKISLKGSDYIFNIQRWIRDDDQYQYLGTLGGCKKNYHRVQRCEAKTVS